MSIIQTLQSAATAELTSIERGFTSIGARLAAIGVHISDAIVHPGTPKPLRDSLPHLLDVIEDLRQEVAELRKPCPCEGLPDLNDPAVMDKVLEVAKTVHAELDRLDKPDATSTPQATGEGV